jgi:hypothetical protein
MNLLARIIVASGMVMRLAAGIGGAVLAVVALKNIPITIIRCSGHRF